MNRETGNPPHRDGPHKKSLGRSALQRKMRTIAALQHRLRPSQVPLLQRWGVAVSYQANGLPGGDYYDFFRLADGRHLALVVADASGHGGAAAVLVAQVRAFLHSCPLTCGHARSPFCPVEGCTIPPPGVILGHLSHLLEENSLSEQFMTAFYGVLATDTGTLHYANAGHPPPRWWRSALGTVEPVPDRAGPPLGLGLSDAYPEASISLEPGDVLALYSDGLVDAHRRRDGPFGVHRLDAAIRKGAAGGPEAVSREVMDSLEQYLAGEECDDDVTLVVLARQR
jgi:sigma-B regulation protein RsbU (phosphoserine phosphatase)